MGVTPYSPMPSSKLFHVPFNSSLDCSVRQEDDCIEYITQKISSSFDVTKVMDGCLADFAVKPKIIASDEWMMVQMKTTKIKKNGYGFHLQMKSDYTNCMMLMMCVADKKVWLIDFDVVKDKTKITIGETISKYDKYCVKEEELVSKMNEFYGKMTTKPIESIHQPLSQMAIREKEYRIHREQKCNFIKFEYPTRSQLCYDFLIHGKRVQEKVGGYNKNGSIVFLMYKNNGMINGKRSFKLYQRGDNDFYWLHSQDKKVFYVVPEYVLIDQKYIAEKGEVLNRRYLFIAKDNLNDVWMKNFQFDYDNLDESRLKQLLGI